MKLVESYLWRDSADPKESKVQFNSSAFPRYHTPPQFYLNSVVMNMHVAKMEAMD
jgi:hypothetical protein